MCGQVWWPILGICPLHLTHPSAHSQQWTHTRSSGQPFCGARGAVGGSVPCSRVSPQSWYWRWREHLLFTPPTDNPCRTWESNLQPLGYKSNSLTIRPRLPPVKCDVEKQKRAKTPVRCDENIGLTGKSENLFALVGRWSPDVWLRLSYHIKWNILSHMCLHRGRFI